MSGIVPSAPLDDPQPRSNPTPADASLEEVTQVCRLFQWLLPGPIVNVAYFRHQLEAE